MACIWTGKAAKATGMIWGAAGAGASWAAIGLGAEISQGLFSLACGVEASGAESRPGVGAEMSQGLVSLGSGGGVGGLGRLDGGT